MQGIFQKENTDKALKYGIYRHLPTYEKIIRNLETMRSALPATTNLYVEAVMEKVDDYTVKFKMTESFPPDAALRHHGLGLRLSNCSRSTPSRRT